MMMFTFLTLQDFRDFRKKKVYEKPSRNWKKVSTVWKKVSWVVSFEGKAATPEIIHLPSLTNGYRGWKAVGNRLEKGRSFFVFLQKQFVVECLFLYSIPRERTKI